MEQRKQHEDDKFFFSVCDEAGNTVEYEVLFTIDDKENGYSYIAYTDNTLLPDGQLQVFAKQFDPTRKNPELLPIEDVQVLQVIKEQLAQTQENARLEQMDAEELDTEWQQTIHQLRQLLPQHSETFDQILNDPNSVDHEAFIQRIMQELNAPQ